MATATLSCVQHAGTRSVRGPVRVRTASCTLSRRPRTARVQASFGLYELADAAQYAASEASRTVNEAAGPPGSVNAPIWVVAAAAIVVTLGLSASSFLLKPGVEASERLQKEQQSSWRKNVWKK